MPPVECGRLETAVGFSVGCALSDECGTDGIEIVREMVGLMVAAFEVEIKLFESPSGAARALWRLASSLNVRGCHVLPGCQNGSY